MSETKLHAPPNDDYLSVRRRFIFGEPPDFFQTFEKLLAIDAPLRAPLEAFQQNLSSALMVGNFPFQLAHSSVLDLRFNQILTAERIRSLKTDKEGGNSPHEKEQLAFSVAQNKMLSELESQTIINRHAEHTLKKLYVQISEPKVMDYSEELLRQLIVMSWGALETFVNDIIRQILNIKPIFLLEISKINPYKDAISVRSLLSGLEKSNFDLSSGVGDFLADLVTLDGIEKMQSVSQSLIQSPRLDKAFKSESLWNIAQQRHVIVHRRSVVDKKYKDKTGHDIELGGKLVFDAMYVERVMAEIRDVGCLFYEESCKKIDSI